MVHLQPNIPPRAPAGKRPALWALALVLALLLPPGVAAARVDEGLAAVQRAALAHAGLSPQATSRLLLRQHLAALLPQVRVTLGRGWQISATGRVLDGLPVPVPEVDNDRTSYAVSASWDLGRLLVPHEAMQHHHEEPRRAQLRLALLAKVTQLVAARCLLLRQPEGGAAAAAQAAEVEAALELLTGGQALPEVGAETPCPAAPRFLPSLPLAAPRRAAVRPSASPRRSSLSPGPGGDGDDGGLGDGGLGGLGGGGLDDPAVLDDGGYGGADSGGR